MFVEAGASFTCEKATTVENSTGDQGGGIHDGKVTWVTLAAT